MNFEHLLFALRPLKWLKGKAHKDFIYSQVLYWSLGLDSKYIIASTGILHQPWNLVDTQDVSDAGRLSNEESVELRIHYVLYLTSVYLKIQKWIEDPEFPSPFPTHPTTWSFMSHHAYVLCWLALGSACGCSQLSYVLCPGQCLGDLTYTLVLLFLVLLANWADYWPQVGASLLLTLLF